MLEAFAGMVMAAKMQFAQMKYPIMKRQDRAVAECLYRNEVDKVGETEKYEKGKLPESGYMTVAEYEAKSRAKSKRQIVDTDLKEADMPKDENMVYIPQKKFKLVKYNDPVGSPELNLPRKLNFDRQINAQGIVSGDYTMLVYPAVYYYAQQDCTSCDLFVIKLDSTLSNTEKVKNANIINREEKPILSTDKSIDEKFIFRTLTPIDFSSNNKKLVIKEKIGHRHDGIWKTNLWVYDFETQKARELLEIRDAIVNYWANTGGVDFDENRWDIYPMGFDANNEDRVVVCAYAYTGEVPKFLGTWSIDVDGQFSKLENLSGADFPISVVGYRLEEDSVVTPVSEVEFEAKLAKEKAKKQEKLDKEIKETENEIKKLDYERKLRQMDVQTYIKIKERQEYLKQTKRKSLNGETGN